MKDLYGSMIMSVFILDNGHIVHKVQNDKNPFVDMSPSKSL